MPMQTKPGFGKAGTSSFIAMMSGAPTLEEQHKGARPMDAICFHPSAQLNLPRDTEFQDVPRDRLPETARFFACHPRTDNDCTVCHRHGGQLSCVFSNESCESCHLLSDAPRAEIEAIRSQLTPGKSLKRNAASARLKKHSSSPGEGFIWLS